MGQIGLLLQTNDVYAKTRMDENMDYLRGRKLEPVPKKEKPVPPKPDMTLFEQFVEQAFAMFTSDQRAQLYTEYLNDAIVSVLKDEDLFACIVAFFKNNLNIAETSRNAFLHRNTLLYRIDKIHKITGLNIRNFDDAIIFMILAKMYKKMNYR